MEKKTLKALVTEMYENLLIKIDEQEEATKEQVIEYLRNAASAISSIDDQKLEKPSIDHCLFSDAYKAIASESLISYENTNLEFNKISEMHQKTLDECKHQHIDLPRITEKFNEIQKHMTEEVTKANEIISTLTQQVKILEEKTNLDPLTKVFNRRALSQYLETICTSQSTKYELHMLILDLDDFKYINDRYGHLAGDKVLIFIANILKKTLREGDKIFRYGGEEFVIILNRIDDVLCRKIAKRLLELVQSNNLIYKGESLRVTMSVGGTKYVPTDTPDSLISRADAALYKAKNNGKNQLYTE